MGGWLTGKRRPVLVQDEQRETAPRPPAYPSPANDSPLAREITHVVRRRTAAERMRQGGPVDWKPGMRATLVSDIDDDDHVRPGVKFNGGTLLEVVSNPGLGRIEVRPAGPKARNRTPFYISDVRLEPVGPAAPVTVPGTPAGMTVVPVLLQYELFDPAGPEPGPGSGTGWGAAGVRSTAIGGARGIGFLISPPVRGTFDPLRPLASRLGPPAGPLGVADEVATLERYLTRPAVELAPRYAAEKAELYLRQSRGQSWWLNNFGITERQLGELRGVVARMAQGGFESLGPAEQELMLRFVGAHAEAVAAPGAKIASPALSTTVRQGLSALPDVHPFLRDAPYVVRIQVPADAVLDVNAVLGDQRIPRLVHEAEMLVFTDARGSITSVQPNLTSRLGRAAPVLRWAGRGFLVLGIGVSGARIATATPRELPRVLGEEGGGWLGGAGGSALGAGVCVGFGIATSGVGLLICGAVGGIFGGLGGSYLGGEIGEGVESLRTAGDIANPMIERAIWGDQPIPALGYDPPPRFGQDPR